MAQKAQFQTPKGTAKYAWLNRPDDVFNKENPKYTVDLHVSEADAKDLMDAKKVANDNFGGGKCRCHFPKMMKPAMWCSNAKANAAEVR